MNCWAIRSDVFDPRTRIRSPSPKGSLTLNVDAYGVRGSWLQRFLRYEYDCALPLEHVLAPRLRGLVSVRVTGRIVTAHFCRNSIARQRE